MEERTNQILLALAWLGETTKAQLRDLCCPGMSEKTVQRALAPVIGGPTPLVITRPRHAHDGTAPKREAFVYGLSEAGHKHLGNDPAYPRKTGRWQYPAKVTSPADLRRLEHQLQATEAIVQLIVLARQRSLSGVFVAREVRLNRQRPEPVMDAVVALHMGGEAPARGAVPWTKDAPVAGERVWCFAIESDRATEAPAVLLAKAGAYGAAEVDLRTRDDWRERTGQMLPMVLWVAPTKKRLEVIEHAWVQGLSAGSWMLATPQLLAAGSVWHYRNFERVELRLFAASDPQYLGVLGATPAIKYGGPGARALYPPIPVALPVRPVIEMWQPRTGEGAAATSPTPPPMQVPSRGGAAATSPVLPALLRRPRARGEWAALVAERVLLWPFVAVMIAIGWTAEHIGRGLWWLVRLFGRGLAAVWSWLDDVSEGHPVQAALITVVALLVMVAPIMGPTWWSWFQRIAQIEAVADTVSPTAAPMPLPTLPAATVAAEPSHTCGQARITAPGVRLRPTAGTDNKPLATLAKGVTVELLCDEAVLADSSRWVEVRTKDGTKGWVSAKFVLVL